MNVLTHYLAMALGACIGVLAMALLVAGDDDA